MVKPKEFYLDQIRKDPIGFYKGYLMNGEMRVGDVSFIRPIVLEILGEESLTQLEYGTWIEYWGNKYATMPKDFRLGVIVEEDVPSDCIDAVVLGLDLANKKYSLGMSIKVVNPSSGEYQTEIKRFNSGLEGENIGSYDPPTHNGSYVLVSRRSFGNRDLGVSKFHSRIILALTPERQAYLDAITNVTIHEVITHFLGFYHHEAFALESNYGYKKDDSGVTKYECLTHREPCQRCDEAIRLLIRL